MARRGTHPDGLLRRLGEDQKKVVTNKPEGPEGSTVRGPLAEAPGPRQTHVQNAIRGQLLHVLQ